MSDFDFDDDRRRPPRPARPAPGRRAEAGHGTSAFWTMFGGSVGCILGCLAVVIALAVLGMLASDSR